MHGGQVGFLREFCLLNTYDYDQQDLEQAFEDDSQFQADMTEALSLGISKGFKFDGKNHNFLIFDEYLSLSYSYMTFVIKDKIERRDRCMECNIFDSEPYNYLFNRSTSFMDSQFTKKDPDELKYVLEHLG